MRTGTYEIDRIKCKLVWIIDENKTRSFKVTSVVPYGKDKGDTDMKTLLQGFQQFKSTTICSKPEVSITEVSYPSDPRADAEVCRKAIAKEIVGLLNRGVLEIGDESDLRMDTNILRSQMVLVQNYVGTRQEKYKARFVIGVYENKRKET